MARSRRNVIAYDRTRRRRQWHLADPPPRGKARRRWRCGRPTVYLSAAMLAGVAGLIVLPMAAHAPDAARRPASGGEPCRIVRVVDGDTVRLRCPGRAPAAARLMGFDTPELSEPDCAAERRRAEAAKAYLARRIEEAGTARIERHGRDRYGRLLIRLFLDGRDTAATMIEAGHARAYHGGHRGGWCG